MFWIPWNFAFAQLLPADCPLVSAVQPHHGLDAWLLGQEPRKAPLIVDLRADPFETAPLESSYYDDWLVRHMYVVMPLMEIVATHMETFKAFPPRQESGSFTPKQ